MAVGRTIAAVQGLGAVHRSLEHVQLPRPADGFALKPLRLRIVPGNAVCFCCGELEPALEQAFCLLVELKHARCVRLQIEYVSLMALLKFR